MPVVSRLVVLGVLVAGCAAPLPPLEGEAAHAADLDALVEGLLDRHPLPFLRVPETEFRAAVADLRRRLPLLDDDEVVVGFARIAGLLGDGHTRLLLAEGRPPCAPVVPLRFVGLADGIWIDAVPELHGELLGTRVTAVGDLPIAVVADRLRTIVPCDNESAVRDMVPRYLRFPALLHALGITPRPDDLPLRVVTGNGEVRTATVRGRLPDERVPGRALPEPARLASVWGRQTRPGSYWHDLDRDAGLLYCRYDRCADDPQRSVAAWLREVGGLLDGEPPRTVVIDLRRNSGGNAALLLPLVPRLQAWRRDDPGRMVFVLVGPSTFSSGIDNAVHLREFAGARLVGETPGQPRGTCGEVQRFRLPYSGFDVACSTRVWGDPAHPVEVVPDLAAPMTAAAWFTGRDPAMDVVRALRP